MRLAAYIMQDESSNLKIKGKSLISYQIDALKKFGIKDIFTKEWEEKELKEYDGVFFIGGNLFIEEDFFKGFTPYESYTFRDSSRKDNPNIRFHMWGKPKEKIYDITGKIWQKVSGDTDIFYAENKLGLLAEKENLKKIRLFSFDLDGTTILGKRPIDGAREFIEFLGEKGVEFSFLTNNSSRTNSMHAENLKGILNLPITEENIMSSIDSLELYLSQEGIKSIYPFVNNRVKKYLCSKVQCEEKEPEVVVVGFNTDATYREMERVSELIFKGIPYLLIHPDYRCPTEFGYIPDAGSFGKMFELTTDKKSIWIGGKPNPIMVDGLSKKYGIPKEEIAYVGDRLYTDIDMAKNADIYGFLVLTGESSLPDFYRYTKGKGYDKIFIIDNLIFLKAFLRRILQ